MAPHAPEMLPGSCHAQVDVNPNDPMLPPARIGIIIATQFGSA